MLDYVTGSTCIPALEESLQNRNIIVRIIKANLCRAQQKMKEDKDKHRLYVTFAPNDWVLLRLCPYRQQIVARRISQKLSHRFFGPLNVLRRIGMVIYELELPSSSKLHPVFHVLLLRRFHDDSRESFIPFPHLVSDLADDTPTVMLAPPPILHVPKPVSVVTVSAGEITDEEAFWRRWEVLDHSYSLRRKETVAKKNWEVNEEALQK